MKYMGDADWWNKRFDNRGPELLKYDATSTITYIDQQTLSYP